MVAVALSVFLAGATNANLYYCIQKSYDESAVLQQSAILRADQAIADYLVDGGGELSAQFNERETAHMGDVFRLFENMRLLRAFAFPLGVLLILAGTVKNRNWARVLPLSGSIGFGLFFAPLAVLGIWAVADFHGAFRAMHRLLFDNTLWLLNPQTDYMIQLLPQVFFERIGALLAVRCAISALIPPILLFAGPLFYRKWIRR